MKLDMFTTTFPNNTKTEERHTASFTPDDGTENQVINLYPDARYQALTGFGGAFTDSAGYVFSLMPPKQQAHLLDAYYGAGGAGYRLGRLHLDSCDFSLSHYEAMSDPADAALRSFSLARSEKYLLPLLRRAQQVYGGPIEMMVAPWSPPAFMKDNGARNGGGALMPEYRAMWAEYLCRYIEELERAGCAVRAMSVQNEPKAVQTWDSCIYDAAQEKAFIRDHLYPALLRHNLRHVGIYLWDHNKERVYERAAAILDEQTDPMIEGVAFHWYSGDHFEAVRMVNERFPDKRLAQTEACIEYRTFSSADRLGNAQKYAHNIIGDLNAGMSAFYDWNLVLDERGGPNHVGNYCDAPFLYHTDTGELEERNSYAYIAHFSKYIAPGSIRIGCSRYTDAFEMTAFERPDGRIAAVLLNRGDAMIPAVLRLNGENAPLTMPPQSISTCVIG